MRVVRDGDVNRVRQLRDEQVEELWNSPILRYSNILSGLFHDGVVITEADADCRFYEAIAQVLPKGTDRTLDVFYTYSGGKDRMPTLIAAWHAVGVPVRVVADIDVLRDETLLSKIVETLGGRWAESQAQFRATKTAIEERKNWFRVQDLRQKIDEVLVGIDGQAVVDKAMLNRIAKLCRQTSPWEEIKRNGIPGPLSGEAARSATALLTALAECGLFVVPVGEMECFEKTIGGEGPRWVEQVMARDLAGDPKLREAREFVGSVLRSFRRQSG